jgi:hypothetical protein
MLKAEEEPSTSGRIGSPLRASGGSTSNTSNSSSPSRAARPARAPLYELKDTDFKRPSRLEGSKLEGLLTAAAGAAVAKSKAVVARGRQGLGRTQARSLSQPPESRQSAELENLAGVCPTKLNALAVRQPRRISSSHTPSDGYRCAAPRTLRHRRTRTRTGADPSPIKQLTLEVGFLQLREE